MAFYYHSHKKDYNMLIAGFFTKGENDEELHATS